MFSTCQVGDWHVKPHALVHVQYSAQRWVAFQNIIGSGPCGRSGHAIASDGTRILLLGGKSSSDAKANDSGLIYVLDTSMYFFVISLGRTPEFKAQKESRTRIPTSTLSILLKMRRTRVST